MIVNIIAAIVGIIAVTIAFTLAKGGKNEKGNTFVMILAAVMGVAIIGEGIASVTII
jgi:hypothetical protein